MSATYEAAQAALDAAESVIGAGEGVLAAQVGTGRAVLALAEEVEALVELLRERLPTPPVVEYHYRADGPRLSSEVPGDPRCSRCLDRRSVHDEALGHPFTESGAPSFEALEAMGPRCVKCSIRRDLHIGRDDLGHPWDGGGSA